MITFTIFHLLLDETELIALKNKGYIANMSTAIMYIGKSNATQQEAKFNFSNERRTTIASIQ